MPDEVTLTSKKKWFWLGIAIALLSPFSGLLFGIVLWTEPEFKKEAKIILAISLIWGLLFIFLYNWLVEQGYLPG
jgi:hypothetical protein